MIRQIKATPLDRDVRKLLLPSRSLKLLILRDDICLVPPIIIVSELEEDQPENWNGVFAWLEIGVSAQLVCGCPKVFFELFELFFCHFVSLPITPALKATHSTRVNWPCGISVSIQKKKERSME